jgi:hypothetical protein
MDRHQHYDKAEELAEQAGRTVHTIVDRLDKAAAGDHADVPSKVELETMIELGKLMAAAGQIHATLAAIRDA